MPPVSEAQRRAMFAAAEGRSTLGIPKAAGEEFLGKDASGHAAGILYVAPDGDVLLLRRSSTEENYAGHWALPGGKADDDEAPLACAMREAKEELGTVPAGEPRILDSRMTPTGMAFHTYAQPVEEKFVPRLNDEHSGYAWASLDMLPGPVHPGVAATLQERLGIGADMSPEEWAALRQGFAKWTHEEEAEPEHASDGIAFDRATVRSIDQDGHLRVEITPLSKANVCPYYGREIPDWKLLGLEPERLYQLYRDPEELRAGAETFAGKPLLLIHTAVSAGDHPREVTVGAVGDDVVFDPPYLKAPLTVWDGEAIALIDSGERKELSSSYRYRADMTPGTAPDGTNYDGVMREIRANHVALVERGRAGSDVLVQDSMPAGLAATIPNSGTPAAGSKRAAAQDREKETAMADKSAKDAKARDEGLMGKLEDLLKEKLSDDEMESLRAKFASDEDETEEERKEREAKEKAAADEEAERQKAADEEAERDEEEKKANDKKAMDAAIEAAVVAERGNQNAIREAERFVRPWVGELATVAFDSAEAVYKKALEMRGKNVAGVHPSAYRSILEMMPKPGALKPSTTRVAMDAASSKAFADRFPEASAIRVG